MEVKAFARHIRIAPRKVRLITNLVKKLPADVAIAQLKMLPKGAARPVRKLIESAVANAIHNNKLDREKLFIQSITADGGPTLKRWRPRAFGRAGTIRKRTTHIAIVLSDQAIEEKKLVKKEKRAKKEVVSESAPKQSVKKEISLKKS